MSTIQTKHIYRINLNAAPLEVRLDSPLTHQDAQADTFTAILRQGMVPLTLNGTEVKGFLMLHRQKATIPLEGTAANGEASLTLTSACYQPGPFTLTMQLQDGVVRHSVLHVHGSIVSSASGTVMDPEDVIPTLSELLAEIDQMRQATQVANTAAQAADTARLGIDGKLADFRNDLYTPMNVLWEEGTLNNNYGTNNESTTRARTLWLPARNIGYVRANEGYQAAVYAYDSADAYLGRRDWADVQVISSILEDYPAALYLRITLRATDEHDLTPEEAAANTVIAGIDADVLAAKMADAQTLINSLFTPIPLESGGVKSANGNTSTDSMRLRTDYIPVEELALARCDGNYLCLYMAYQDGTYLGYHEGYGHGPFTSAIIREEFPDATHVRFVIRARINRSLDPETDGMDSGIVLLRNGVREADTALADEIEAVLEQTLQAHEELVEKIAQITNDGTRAHTLLEEKIASATDGAAKARAVIEERIAAAELAAAQAHQALDTRIDDAAADAASTAQVLTSMVAAASRTDGITASLSMYDRVGVCGASWDSGYIYTSRTDVIEKERLSWPHMLAMRCGFTLGNYSYHGVGAKDWLTHAKCGVKMLADDPCDLYICTLGGNDLNKRGTAYIGSLADITGYANPADYPSSFYGDYGRIIESIRTHAPNARILLIFWYNPAIHDPDGEGRQLYHEAVQALAGHYGLPCINWDDDPWYPTVHDNQLGNHPTAVQLGGISFAFERLYSSAVNRYYRYFCHYPEPAPAFIPLQSNLADAVWVEGTGNGYSTAAAGTEMLTRINTTSTGLFATTGQGSPLRELDTNTWELTGNTSPYYPIAVPTYARTLHVEGPDGCQVAVITSVLKNGVWHRLAHHDWVRDAITVDLTTDVADGVSINIRYGSANQARVWFE